MKLSRKAQRTLGTYFTAMIQSKLDIKKAAPLVDKFYENKVKPEEDVELSIFYHILYVNLVTNQMLNNKEYFKGITKKP